MTHTRTVAEARADFARQLHERGETTCPVCDRAARQYQRMITSSMALALAWVVRRIGAGRWFHAPEQLARAGDRMRMSDKLLQADWAKLQYWGLIEPRPREEDGFVRSGEWRVTERGRRFVEMEEQVPSAVLVYNGACLGVAEDARDISIRDALGRRFEIYELMRPAVASVQEAQGRLF